MGENIKRKAKLIYVCSGTKEENMELIKPLEESLVSGGIADNFPVIDCIVDDIKIASPENIQNIIGLLSTYLKNETNEKNIDLLWDARNLLLKLRYNEKEL